ncbi:hypothetical protein [Candidatus Planktophila versatilis]|uniref:hypothetical protein n=1 Tax=Candidatus Planktophila versatilis TaxID=1884905 RepID=UPI0016815301|nr:hypothetical protein [Candidatus Planktophila versatilis]
MKIFISLVCVATIAIILSRRLRLSTRYERSPRTLTQWNALDKGIDPTEEKQ